jgi:hypothetical protein
MKIEYKMIDSVRVGDMRFETLIMIEKENDGDSTYIHPVIRIMPEHNSPFYQDIVLGDWSGLEKLSKIFTKLNKELTKMD